MVKYYNEIQIAFDVHGTVHQRVLPLKPDYSEEEIIMGLEAGTLCTTTWHNGTDEPVYIDVTTTGEHVALVISQEIEGEYFDYR